MFVKMLLCLFIFAMIWKKIAYTEIYAIWSLAINRKWKHKCLSRNKDNILKVLKMFMFDQF